MAEEPSNQVDFAKYHLKKQQDRCSYYQHVATALLANIRILGHLTQENGQEVLSCLDEIYADNGWHSFRKELEENVQRDCDIYFDRKKKQKEAENEQAQTASMDQES